MPVRFSFWLSPGIWLADFLGTTVEQAYLYTIFLQIVVFAVGELIWSPRLSEYTVTIAPKGREGTYMSLAALPMFLAKPLNGWVEREVPHLVLPGRCVERNAAR